METKKIHIPSLVLMIIGAVFAIIFPLVTYPCCIISLVMSIKKRKSNIATYAIIINTIALMVALVNSVLGAMLATGMLQK